MKTKKQIQQGCKNHFKCNNGNLCPICLAQLEMIEEFGKFIDEIQPHCNNQNCIECTAIRIYKEELKTRITG